MFSASSCKLRKQQVNCKHLVFCGALRCPYKGQINFKFLVYRENTLVYVYANVGGKMLNSFRKNTKTNQP